MTGLYIFGGVGVVLQCIILVYMIVLLRVFKNAADHDRG